MKYSFFQSIHKAIETAEWSTAVFRFKGMVIVASLLCHIGLALWFWNSTTQPTLYSSVERTITIHLVAPLKSIHSAPLITTQHEVLHERPPLLPPTSENNILTTVVAPITTTPEITASPVVISAPKFNVDYLHHPEPHYPESAHRLGEQGTVILRVHVTAEGHADKVEIHSSSDSKRLDNAAREIVMKWDFIPAKRGNEAISDWVLIPYKFVLK